MENDPTRTAKNRFHHVLAAMATILVLGVLSTFAVIEYRARDDCLRLIDHPAALRKLKEVWQRGQAVAVIRHASKCDKDLPDCTNGNEHLTELGRQEARSIGEGISDALGNSFVAYHSYLDRTRDTALLAFGKSSVSTALQKPCADTFPQFISSLHPADNTILVTHSSCLDSMKDAAGDRLLGINTSKDPNFGIAAFIDSTVADDSRLLGCIWPSDWEQMNAAHGSTAGNFTD